MDKQAILALLEETFRGVRKDALSQLAGVIAIQAKDEEKVREIIARYSTQEVEAFAKDYRSEVDREVGDARRKIEETMRRKWESEYKPKPSPEESKEEEQGAKQDVQALIRSAIAEALKPLEDKLAQAETKTLEAQRSQRLEELLGGCKSEAVRAKALKDYARMRFDSPEEFEAYLKETTETIEAVNLSHGSQSLVSPRPLSGRGAQEDERRASDEEIAEVLGKIKD